MPAESRPSTSVPLRRLAILTGGGDCPGINAVIRAVAKSAMRRLQAEVLGIEDGFLGLVENRVRALTDADVSGVLTVGGSLLGSSNRCDPRRYAPARNGAGVPGLSVHAGTPASAGGPGFVDVTETCLATLREHRVDALVVIGGDGTMSIARHFSALGVPVVGVPKTIDNDLPGTELTFGFLTAVSTATDALDRVHTTGRSHHRAMVVEVMGRNAGWLALYSGVASGADIILIPEIPFDVRRVCEVVSSRRGGGKGFSILAVAEGARPIGGQATVARIDAASPDPVRLGGVGATLARQIEDATGVESRVTVLGHVQRGGSPIPPDRTLATHLGVHAVRLLSEGRFGRVAAWQRGRVTDVSIEEAAPTTGGQRLVRVDDPLIDAARAIGASFGD